MAIGTANPESSANLRDESPQSHEAQAAAPRTFRLPRLIAAVGQRLPQFPHSVALAVGLNIALRPLLPEDTLAMLRGRSIGFRIEDAGAEMRVRLGERGFMPVFGNQTPDVVFSACAYDFYLMARRLEDPDTLFFNRRLKIEGDTELGLVVKNALDALDLHNLPAPLRAMLERAGKMFSGAGKRR